MTLLHDFATSISCTCLLTLRDRGVMTNTANMASYEPLGIGAGMHLGLPLQCGSAGSNRLHAKPSRTAQLYRRQAQPTPCSMGSTRTAGRTQRFRKLDHWCLHEFQSHKAVRRKWYTSWDPGDFKPSESATGMVTNPRGGPRSGGSALLPTDRA